MAQRLNRQQIHLSRQGRVSQRIAIQRRGRGEAVDEHEGGFGGVEGAGGGVGGGDAVEVGDGDGLGGEVHCWRIVGWIGWCRSKVHCSSLYYHDYVDYILTIKRRLSPRGTDLDHVVAAFTASLD